MIPRDAAVNYGAMRFISHSQSASSSVCPVSASTLHPRLCLAGDLSVYTSGFSLCVGGVHKDDKSARFSSGGTVQREKSY